MTGPPAAGSDASATGRSEADARGERSGAAPVRRGRQGWRRSGGMNDQPSAELPRTTQERLLSQPQPSPSGSEEPDRQ